MSEIAAALAAKPFSATAFNALLLLADALLYFAVLAALFRARPASASAPFSARSG